MKRFIAVLVCVFMLTSMIPAVAFAAEEPADNQQQEQTVEPDQQQNQVPPVQPDQQQEQKEPEQKEPEQKEQQAEQQQKTDASIQSTTTQNTEEGQNPPQQVEKVTVSVSANPAAGGTVSGGGTYDVGGNASLTATASAEYTFVNWTLNNNVVSTDASCTVTVAEGGGNYVANFKENEQQDPVDPANTGGGGEPTTTDPADIEVAIEVGVSTEGGDGTEMGGKAEIKGTCKVGETITLVATAFDGYEFVKWTKDKTEKTNEEWKFVVEAGFAGKYVAHFKKIQTYTISVYAGEGGSVTGGGTYNEGATAELVATPNDGYRFVNWTKDGESVSTSAEYTFIVTETATYQANFELIPEQVTVNVVRQPAAGGTVNGGGKVDKGTDVTLTATANAGYVFKGWNIDGNPSTTIANTLTLAKVEANCTVTAVFAKLGTEQDETAEGAKTTTNLTALCKTVVKGANVAVELTVKAKNDAGKTVTPEVGTVNIYVNDKYIKNYDPSTLRFTLPASEFELGTNTVEAVYVDDTGAFKSSSDTVTVKVVKAACKPVNPCKPCNVCNTCTSGSGKCATVRAGEDVTLKVSLSCGETCQWYVDKGDGCGFVKIKGADDATYTVKDATSKMDGYRYRCVVTKACKVVANPTFTLNVVSGGCLTFPKTGDMSIVSPVVAMGAAAAALLRRKDEE